MATFTHDEIDLWFDTIGTGELLIALHGGLGLDHTTLRPWLDPLAQDMRLAYLDHRANGRSGGDGHDMTMTQLAGDVEALRRHLGAERAWLLGHSYGGFVALQCAMERPETLHGIVLCDTDSKAPSGETVTAELARLGADLEQVMPAFATPIETQDDLLAFFEVLAPYYLPHSPADRTGSLLADLIFRREGAAGGDRALADWDVSARLGEVAVPTLVIAGADDFLFPPAVTHALGDALPHAEVVVLDGAGHLPFVEQQDAFLHAVRSFVAPA